jgi:adenosylcobinamide-GDP ribazoletransferase
VKSMLRSIRAAVRFLTRLPIAGPDTTADDLPGATLWFPVVGALVGLVMGAVFLQLSHLWPAPAAALLAVALGLLITGAMHEDAVADSADGLGGAQDPAALLRIMADPRVGSYGVCALWLLLALRVTALVLLAAAAPAALVLALAWGRWSSVPLLRCLPSLHAGLGRDLGRSLRWWHLLGSLLAVLAISAATWPWLQERALLASLFAIIGTASWALYLRRGPGGQNGDLLGAGNQLVEAVVLLTCLADMAS